MLKYIGNLSEYWRIQYLHVKRNNNSILTSSNCLITKGYQHKATFRAKNTCHRILNILLWRRWGGVGWNAVVTAWDGWWTHELTTTVVTYNMPAKMKAVKHSSLIGLGIPRIFPQMRRYWQLMATGGWELLLCRVVAPSTVCCLCTGGKSHTHVYGQR